MSRSLLLLFLLSLTSFGFLCAQQYPPLELSADVVSTTAGSTVDVSVRAGQNFQNITTLNGTLVFDTTVISYNSLVFFGLSNPGGANFTYQGGGVLTYTWNSLITIGPTLSLGSPVFTLRFNAVGNAGDVSPVNFATTPQQMYWANGFG